MHILHNSSMEFFQDKESPFTFKLLHLFLEIVRAFTYVINQGWAMYWGTSRWSPTEIMVNTFIILKQKNNLH